MSSSGTTRPLWGLHQNEESNQIARLEATNSFAPSSNDIAISVNRISKRYEIYETPRDRLKQFILPRLQDWLGNKRKDYFREYWAVREVSFEVKKGEAFGIIGRNGSGKSTLLQIICGTLSPTLGAVRATGRIAALLELGSGFSPDFTGRENVYLNAALLGISKEETDERFDAIAAFADIGQFIDQPVNTYSSGMAVRLAFAVQCQLQPDILVVDEALSVGDFFFQQKCFRHIRSLRESGVTLLFVSHDMSAVRDICNRVMCLKEGRVGFIGATTVAIRYYMSESQPAVSRLPADEQTAEDTEGIENLLRDAVWTAPVDTYQEGIGRIIAVAFYDEAGCPSTSFRLGSTITVKVAYFSTHDVLTHVSIIIKNRYDQVVTSTGSSRLGLHPPALCRQQLIIFEMDLHLMLEAGQYAIIANIGHSIGPNHGNVVYSTSSMGPIDIGWDYERERAPFLGMVGLPVVGRFKIARKESLP